MLIFIEIEQPMHMYNVDVPIKWYKIKKTTKDEYVSFAMFQCSVMLSLVTNCLYSIKLDCPIH